MRIGVMIGADRAPHTFDRLVAIAREVESAGLDNAWMAHIRAHDAIVTLAVAGRETTRIGLGTAVTPTFPRHPIAMAQQALTAAAATGGRFTLGIGLSHKPVIEKLYGLSYDHPARHMREYLEVLMPLLAGETVNYDGQVFNVHDIAIEVPGTQRPPVVVAALGPAMLNIAGSLADGTNTWMVGPNTMADHIIKRLHAAAAAAGRPDPLVVGGFPVVITDNPDAVRQSMAEPLAVYGQLPSYRAMLEREGAGHPVDLALVGNEQTVGAQLQRLRDIGVTDFMGAIFDVEDGAWRRTVDFLSRFGA
ncbi:MAG: TIGR03564 family F420-dependent LLM class oxidoreductase [Gammaproteobacteria bacterium]|jgi:F420-dependent oxidoreductase-like protein